MTLPVTHWLFETCTVLKIQWQYIKLPRKKISSSGYEIGMHIKENFPMPLEAVKLLFQVATHAVPILRTSPHKTDWKRIIMGHLWFHVFHFPLCVTVINILLTQNTGPQWFTWANYIVYCTSVSIPRGQRSAFLSLSHNLSPLLLTILSIFIFHQAGSRRFS